MSDLKSRIPLFLALAVLFIGGAMFLLKGVEKTGFAVSQVTVENVPPTNQALISPENNSAIYEDEPLSFVWNNSKDLNNDPVTYNFMLATDENFTNIAYNISEIPEEIERTNHTPNITYIHSDYFWQVRGFDNESYGNWSDFFKFRYCVGNSPPEITPIGEITIFQNDYFRYQVLASDLENDFITFSDNSPIFEINSTTGIISTLLSTPGTFIITIVAFDSCNATHDIFILNVISRTIYPNEGGGPSPAPAEKEEKKNMTNQTPVRELTPEELAIFSRAQIIYIGNFKDQSIFNVTMYKGPIWFFTYEGTNYFLTLTQLTGESMYIGFFDGPGFLFRKPADVLADINRDSVPDISIAYNNRTEGNYSITLEALKKPERQFPQRIMNVSLFLGLFFAAAIIFSSFMLGKRVINDFAKRRGPLSIRRAITKEKAGLFKVELIARNVGAASLYNLMIEEPLQLNAQIEGEIEIEKDAATEIEKTLEPGAIKLKISEFAVHREMRMSYFLKQVRRPQLLTGGAEYQLKILDTYVHLSKRY
jgi:hypothetical protein